MDSEPARVALARTLAGPPMAGGGPDLRAARQLLIDRGCAAIGDSSLRSLDDIIVRALAAPLDDALREFAVLLVLALGVENLLRVRGEAAARLRSLLERALLNPLRRASYPFDGSAYEKRQALAALHGTIDEHLRPLEASIPSWLHAAGSQQR